MEKKQVSTFLKILQIPTDAPPEEIKDSLLASGWNEADADEAIRVLYPTYSATDGDAEATPVTKQPQLVAQRYVKPAQESEDDTETTPPAPALEDEPVQSEVATFTPEAVTAPEPEPVPEPPPPQPEEPSVPEEPAAPVEPEVEPATVVPPPPPKTKAPAMPEEEFDFAAVAKAHAAAAQQQEAAVPTRSPEEEAAAERTRPHTDAPWLKEQVDIYDVTEEEKQEMIRTVYRTNERLTPQTIHALLGIDVDLSEYEAVYQKRNRNEISGIQIAVIFLSSLAIAAIALYLGLYYFEVGPFHPSITGGR